MRGILFVKAELPQTLPLENVQGIHRRQLLVLGSAVQLDIISASMCKIYVANTCNTVEN